MDVIRKGTQDRPSAGRKPAQKHSTKSKRTVHDDDTDDVDEEDIEEDIEEILEDDDSLAEPSSSYSGGVSRTRSHGSRPRKKLDYDMTGSPDID